MLDYIHPGVNSHTLIFNGSFLSVCATDQPKQLRKMIQQTFQGYSTLNQDQCMCRFFTTLAQCHSYTQEIFACQLVVSLMSALVTQNIGYISVTFQVKRLVFLTI